jgi:hypothetical protein
MSSHFGIEGILQPDANRLPGTITFAQLSRCALVLGLTITAFASSFLLVSSLFLLIGLPVAWYHLPVAAALSGFFCWRVAGGYFQQAQRRIAFTVAGCAALAFTVFAILNGLIYDTSWDGQNYHMEAIVQLANGWNPFYTHPTAATYAQLMEFFTKGTWISAAALYKLTGNLEQGKAFHLLLMLAAFLLSTAAFSTIGSLKPRWIFLFSALMAFNPVSLTQMFTFYVDGLLASLLVITVALYILLDYRPSRGLMLTLAGTVLLMVNIKLNGALYAAVLATGYVLWYFLHRKPRRVELALWMLAGFAVGTLLVGYNPYITQYTSSVFANGNPFYPSDWKTLIQVEYNSPHNFLSMGWGEKLVSSLFSQSQANSDPSQWKWPFTVSMDEILAFRAPDVRVAGFGPLFGGALLVTGALLVVGLTKYRQRLPRASLVLFLITAILITIVTNAEAWWARYVPQLWMIPLLILLVLTVLVPEGRLAFWTRVSLVILAVNLSVIAIPAVINAVQKSIQQTQQLADLQNLDESVRVNFDYFVSTEFRFKEWGIPYQAVRELPCAAEQQITIVGTESRICPP